MRKTETKVLPVRIGTAGWAIPKDHKGEFPAEGSHIERYAEALNAVEINSSFYRDHQAKTYERWADSVPEDFRFSVKLAKEFTHAARLDVDTARLRENLAGISALGEKLGCLLVQLPPSLGFLPGVATRFFSDLRKFYPGPVAFEPRHPSWDSPEASIVVAGAGLARVVADPPPYSAGETSSGFDPGFAYYRLHGSPEIYKSDYDPERLQGYATDITTRVAEGGFAWCIFDNTTFGHATKNALELRDRLATFSLGAHRSFRHDPQTRPLERKTPPVAS